MTFEELWERYSFSKLTKEDFKKDVLEWDRYDGRLEDWEIKFSEFLSMNGEIGSFFCKGFNLTSSDLERISSSLSCKKDICKPYLPSLTFHPISPYSDPQLKVLSPLLYKDERRIDLDDGDLFAMGWDGILDAISEDIHYFLKKEKFYDSNSPEYGSNNLYDKMVRSKKRSFPFMMYITPRPFKFRAYEASSPYATEAIFSYILWCFYGQSISVH